MDSTLHPIKPASVSSLFDVKHLPVHSWGCGLADKEYLKKYKVGQGSYGEVYQAKKKSTGETVAIKRMSLERCSEGFPTAAIREIRLLSKLNHKNIVKLIEVTCAKYAPPEHLLEKSVSAPFNYPWNFFMVCEYMQHSLRGLIERSISLSIPQIKYILGQVLEGLVYLHSNNIMHRDIKCSNILVNGEGEVKLADFGMSTEFFHGKPLSGEKAVVTRWYRAPELLLKKEYTEAVDIWALGCVFAELLSGNALFKGRSDSEQLRLIFEGLRTPGNEDTAGYLKKKVGVEKIDEIGLDLLVKMLELDPNKRITAREAQEHKYFKAQPLSCTKEGMPHPTGDSHEFLLRVHQTNKTIAESSVMSETGCVGPRKRRGCEQGMKAKKKRTDEGGLIEPSTKESISLK